MARSFPSALPPAQQRPDSASPSAALAPQVLEQAGDALSVLPPGAKATLWGVLRRRLAEFERDAASEELSARDLIPAPHGAALIDIPRKRLSL